jgi:hypothetical protein
MQNKKNFNYSLQNIDYTLYFFLNAIAFSFHQGKRALSLIREFWDTCSGHVIIVIKIEYRSVIKLLRCDQE